jgi:flagellar biosynthesis/type III secretory pathway protein FliH
MRTAGLIHVRVVHCDEPLGGVLESNTVDRMFEPERIIKGARDRAAVLLRKARKRKAEVMNECEAQMSASKFRAIGAAEEIVKGARKKAIEEAVAWLLDEAELEAQVTQRVQAQLRTIIAHAVRQWACSTSMAEAVAGAVSSAVSEQRLSSFVVRVSPDSLSAVAVALEDCVECTVKADPAVRSGAAEIDSEFVHISFDLASELETIIDAIRCHKEST